MLTVNVIRHSFLKRPVRVLCSCRRSIVTKKKSSWRDPFLGQENHLRFDNIQNSKLTPKGFEVIYVTPLYHFLKWSFASVFFLWGGLCFDTYTFIADKNYIKSLNEKFGNFSAKEKIIQLIGMSSLVLVLQLFASRVVVAIFRKENEFQTLFYGFFGPSMKTYVPHGSQAMEPTAQTIVYNFKGKKVFLLSNGFRNITDFTAVVSSFSL